MPTGFWHECWEPVAMHGSVWCALPCQRCAHQSLMAFPPQCTVPCLVPCLPASGVLTPTAAQRYYNPPLQRAVRFPTGSLTQARPSLGLSSLSKLPSIIKHSWLDDSWSHAGLNRGPYVY